MLLDLSTDIFKLIALAVDQASSYFNLLQVNKKLYQACKEIEPIKRKQFLKRVESHANDVFYVLPNGRREGVYIKYFPSGKINIYCQYINGRTEGIFKEWDFNGNKTQEGFYKNGKMNGLWNYYPEGVGGTTISYLFENDINLTLIAALGPGPYICEDL